MSQSSDMPSSSNFFDVIFFLLSSYWSKFYVNIITGSGVMTISFYKGLTRNPEIGNTPVWVLPNTRRLGLVRNAKFGANVSTKMLLNPAKYQGYSFYRFWVIKEKPTTRTGVKLPHPPFLPPRLGLIFQDSSCSGRTWEIWCLYGGTLNLGEHHKTSSRSILR